MKQTEFNFENKTSFVAIICESHREFKRYVTHHYRSYRFKNNGDAEIRSGDLVFRHITNSMDLISIRPFYIIFTGYWNRLPNSTRLKDLTDKMKETGVVSIDYD